MDFIYPVSALIVFAFTTVLTIAGLGGAFIIIPIFYWLGIPLVQAMAVALLLNAIGMTVASANYIRYRLVDFRAAIPIILVAVVFSPLGAYSAHYFRKDILLFMFVLFLLFAGSMMLFYSPQKRLIQAHHGIKELNTGIGIGAGYLGGLLGVGGGNFIIPALVWLGFDAKRASATTAFIVIFSSLSGFFGHATMGAIPWKLLVFSTAGSIAGALIGSWLMHKKLSAKSVKKIIGLVLYTIALKMAWELI